MFMPPLELEMEMKHLKKTVNVLLAFVLVFGFYPIAPSAARADGGDLKSAAATDLAAGSGSALSGKRGSALTVQADSTVSSWGDLQTAIKNAKDSDEATAITLGGDIVAGDLFCGCGQMTAAAGAGMSFLALRCKKGEKPHRTGETSPDFIE